MAIFLKLINLLFLAALGLCKQAFSSCGEQGLLSSCGAQASHCGGFCCGAWALGCGLQWLRCRSLVASWLPDHGGTCHLKADHQGSPWGCVFKCRSLSPLRICIFTNTPVVSDPC